MPSAVFYQNIIMGVLGVKYRTSKINNLEDNDRKEQFSIKFDAIGINTAVYALFG